MIEQIALFYTVAFTIYLALHFLMPNLAFALNFTWFGPIPKQYELLSEFKLRKILYATSLGLQLVYAMCILYAVGNYFPWVQNENIFLVFAFGITIGIGIAVLAIIGFVVSFGKTKFFGPDPYFDFVEEEDLDEET